jgi:hypothetical protein
MYNQWTDTKMGLLFLPAERAMASGHQRLISCLRRLIVWLCAIGLIACCQPSLAADSHDAVAVREVVKRSIPFIEREGAQWITSKQCVSCHHTSFMVWSLTAAKRAGVDVDQVQLNQWTEWARDWRHFAPPPTDGAPVDRASAVRKQGDTIAQLLLADVRSDAQANPPQWIVDYANDLASFQQADGAWLAGGQLPDQKRPKRETQEVSTMWALLALDAAHTNRDTLSAQWEKAHAWLGDATAGASTEWWAARSMLERRLGKTERADHYREELIKRQRADGGWGWLCEDTSDALGTGIALFAIADDEQHPAPAAVANARRFLAQSQDKDGSWPTHGTKEGKKNRVEATATYWATCWAVIGLCATLED